MVIDYIEGQSGVPAGDRERYLELLARWLARIHATDVGALSFLPRKELDPVPRGRVNAQGLLHGDVWPGNVILRDDEVVGVIDWEDAAIGDPLADLAITRIELLWALDRDAMERITELYLVMTEVDPGHLAHWDLEAVRELEPQLAHWGLDPDTLREMRAKLAWFEAQAAARLGLG
jgi:aminoglycoside phosphotransferase (APT) family kinase protein